MVDELVPDMKKFREEVQRINGLPEQVRRIDESLASLSTDVEHIRRRELARAHAPGRGNVARNGSRRSTISDEAAQALAAHVILGLERSGKMDGLFRDDALRLKLLRDARNVMDIQQRYTGQTTTEFPLPYAYGRDVAMLIAEYGVARNAMTRYPMYQGTAKPPRHKTGMTFGSIAMAALFTEKNPAYEFATLEPHKVGGIVVTPRELFENSLVEVGNYLADLGAYAFAEVEDAWAFLADGSGTYESVKGVCAVASDNSKVVTMPTGSTSPDDIRLSDFIDVLSKVNTKARTRGAWYLNNTFEAKLPSINTEAFPYYYFTKPDGTSMLFGRPIVWTEVLQPWTADAAAGKYVAVFGDLRFWWMGQTESGPRIDTSSDVLFQYDQIATRFLEEIDFDYMAADAAAALKTAAS